MMQTFFTLSTRKGTIPGVKIPVRVSKFGSVSVPELRKIPSGSIRGL